MADIKLREWSEEVKNLESFKNKFTGKEIKIKLMPGFN